MTSFGRFVLVLLAALVALVAIAGCGGGQAEGGDGGGDAGGDGGVPLSPADQAFLADFCTSFAPCCATNGVTTDLAVCKQSMAKVGQSRDPQVRAACLDELRQMAATRACMPDFGDLTGPCARLFDEPSGPRAPGEICASAAECAGSPETVTHCFGTCITYAMGAEGDYPCLGNVFHDGLINDIPWKNGSTTPESHAFLCEQRAGLYCDWNDNICKRRLPAGSACTTAVACGSGTCGYGDTNGCLPLPAVGEACILDCAGDNTCDAGVCVPQRPAGAACDDPKQCAGDCGGSDLCFGSCLASGVCSPLTLAQSFLIGVWCGATPVRD